MFQADPSVLREAILNPVTWMPFFQAAQQQRETATLLSMLQDLDASSVRDARIGQTLSSLGRNEEALEVLNRHTDCFLCRAWYFAVRMKDPSDDLRRRIATDLKPENWPITKDTVSLEARYRGFLVEATAAFAIGRQTQAQAAYFNAFEIARALGDTSGAHIVSYEMAYQSMYSGEVNAALGRFEAVLSKTLPGVTINVHAREYALVCAFLLQKEPDWAPDWALAALRALKGKEVRVPLDGEAAHSFLPGFSSLVADMQLLNRHFYRYLPLYHIEEHDKVRQDLVDRICQKAGDVSAEVSGFWEQSLKALAQAMGGRKEALDTLKKGFRFPVTNFPLMSMTYMATLVQVHAHLPKLERDVEVQMALRMLKKQISFVKDTQLPWLLWWMHEFTPVTLYLLSGEHPKLQDALQDCVIVTKKRVTVGGQKVDAYPKKWMSDHAPELLAGGVFPVKDKPNAYRHLNTVSAVGPRPVIIAAVAEPFQQLME